MIELTENCFLLHTVCDISNHYIFIGKVSSKLYNYSINFVVIQGVQTRYARNKTLIRPSKMHFQVIKTESAHS